MKNRFLAILLSILLVSFNSTAQKVKVDWGKPEMSNLKESTVNGVIGTTTDAYYLFKVKVGGLFTSTKSFIEKCNNAHEVVFSKEIDFEVPFLKDEVDYEGTVLTNSNIIVFGSRYDKKQDKNSLYACTYSLDGKKEEQWKEVDDIDAKRKRNSGGFTIQIAENKARVLIMHDEPYAKNENEKFNYKVIDTDLKTVWEKMVTMPFKDKNFHVSTYKIDNDANVVMLASVTRDGKNIKGVPNYTYKIIQYDYKKDEFTKMDLSLGKLFISEITFRLDDKNKIIAAGFFSKTIGDYISGAFYLRIDRAKLEIESSGHKEFSKDFLSVYLSDRKIRKGREVYGYDLDHLVLKADGGAILVAEQYYVHVVTTTTRGPNGVTTTTTTYYYYYNDIIAVNINPDASIKWIKRIPKAQYSVNDGGYFSSYVFGVKDDKMYFAFNDNIKNFGKKKKEGQAYVMNKPKKAVVNITTINENGDMESDILFSAKADGKRILRPKMHYQLDDNRILIYAEYKRKYKLGTLLLEK